MFDPNGLDQNKKSKGTVVKFGGGTFTVAYSGNLDFQREMSRLQQPHRKKIDRGSIDPKVSLEIMCEAMSKHILLNWSDVGHGGEEIPYSPEMAYKVLLHNDELREYVQEVSLDLENFRKEQTEDLGES